jgi:four helix bundle protein
MNDSISLIKAKRFSVRIIRLYQYLSDKKKDFVLAKQILRSGTSIGANLAESKHASSKADFLNKIYIALKECSETLYWLELLKETGFLTEKEFKSIYAECEELEKMLTSTTKTLEAKKKKSKN